MTRWKPLICLLCASAVACSTPTPADDAAPGADAATASDVVPAGDGAAQGDGGAGCGEADPVISLFETRCANGGCHGPGARFPELTRQSLAMVPSMMSRSNPSERMIVAGDPARSWLYRKMAGT